MKQMHSHPVQGTHGGEIKHPDESLLGYEIDSPGSREPTLVLVKYAVAAIVVGAITTVVGLGVIVPDASIRTIAPLMMMIVALAGAFMLSRGWVGAAIRVLALGVWAVMAGVTIFTGGVRSPVVVVYPAIILLAGWLINTRAAVGLAAISVAVTLALMVAETWGQLPAAEFTPSSIYAADQIVVYILSAALVVFVLRAYQDRLQQLRSASSDLVQLSRNLEVSQAQLQRAQSVAQVGSWVYEMATDRLQLSAETCRIFGLPEGIIGNHQSYLERIYPDDRAGVIQAWQAALQGSVFDHEHRIVRGQEIRWIRQRAELELAADGTPLRAEGVTQDITEQKQMQEEVRQLAFYDVLTKLPNRRLLSERLSQSMLASRRSARYGALMFMDLDNFKPLNDTQGHGVGDDLLIDVADRLKRCVREIDTVARFGGDEFVVLLNELDTDAAESYSQAAHVAEKIRITLAQPYQLSIKNEERPDVMIEHRCSASIGVALFIDHAADPEEILKRADIAMYQAKDAGRNSIRFYDDGHAAA